MLPFVTPETIQRICRRALWLGLILLIVDILIKLSEEKKDVKLPQK